MLLLRAKSADLKKILPRNVGMLCGPAAAVRPERRGGM
jgi:hypothetical protein